MLSVREIQAADLPLLIKYWLHNDPAHLTGMGVDLAKLPTETALRASIQSQLDLPLQEKAAYAIIWENDGQAVGHSNVNQIVFGEKAYMHLHLWQAPLRKKGMGTALIKMTLPWFFEKLQLQELYCEPYALNPAPNKTLEKIGFEFVKTHTTIPGSLNFEQEVKLWRLTREAWENLKTS